MLRIRERQLASFVPWGPAEFNLSVGLGPCGGERRSNVNGLLLANHTSVSSVIVKIASISLLYSYSKKLLINMIV